MDISNNLKNLAARSASIRHSVDSALNNRPQAPGVDRMEQAGEAPGRGWGAYSYPQQRYGGYGNGGLTFDFATVGTTLYSTSTH